MATPEEVRLILKLGKGSEDDKALKDHLIDMLADRESGAGSTAKCEWCAIPYRKSRRSQKYCTDHCKNEFHNYSRRVLQKEPK